MQLELTARVEMADETCVVDGDAVTQCEQIRLREEDVRVPVCVDSAVVADLRAEEAVVPDDVRRACQQRQDAGAAVAVLDEGFDREHKLPPLVIAALIPVEGTLVTTPDNEPLHADDDGNGEEGLRDADAGHDGGEEAVEHEGAPGALFEAGCVGRMVDEGGLEGEEGEEDC